jgi:hypothetical protein
MPIKQVFESAKAVYPLTTRDVPRVGVFPPGGGISYWYGSPVDTLRIYTLYIDFFRGLFTVKNPTYPGEFEIHLVVVTHQDEWPSWGVETFVWNGKTGAFLGMRETIRSFGIDRMFSGPDGSIWATDIYSFGHLYTCNPVDWTFTEWVVPLNDFGANIGASPVVSPKIAVDPGHDVLITRLTTNNASQLSVCQLSTGDWLRTINMAGDIQAVFVADPPMAYAVEATGNLTAFNYATGEVLGVLHTGLVSGGFTWANLAFSWDPFMRRILYCHRDPDTLPDGDCNTRVKGYYPVPLPVGMTPPIPLRYPQKGKTVPVWNRVYGGAAEGIVGQELTYTLLDDAAATVNPGRKTSENNGTVTVQLAGTLAGANSITCETSVP